MNNECDETRYVALADEGLIEPRTITVDGDVLSLKIETSYWRALEDICRREEMSIEELLGDIRYRLLEQTPRRARGAVTNINIANAVRVFVVGYFRQAATEQGHVRAGHGRGELFLQSPVGVPLPQVDESDRG